MAKTLAATSKEPETDTVTFMMGDAARLFSLRLGKDRGVDDADVERARHLAKQFLGAK
jgi:hypothetical protein